jgi:hypothetical protein
VNPKTLRRWLIVTTTASPLRASLRAVDHATRTRPRGKAATVQPHHDRPLRSVAECRRKHVQHEAIFAFNWSSGGSGSGIHGLGRGRAKREGIARTGPRRGLVGGMKRFFPDVFPRRNTLENSDALDHWSHEPDRPTSARSPFRSLPRQARPMPPHGSPRTRMPSA